MSSMYGGGYRRDPNDLNRRHDVTLPADGDWPTSLKIGHRLSLAAAVLLLLTGFIMLSGYQGDPNADLDYIDALMSNQRFTGAVNIIAGILIALLAAQLRGGGKISRRWLAGVIALTIFVNVAAFAIQTAGVASIAAVVLLAVAALFLFRPAANLYIRTTWAEKQ